MFEILDVLIRSLVAVVLGVAAGAKLSGLERFSQSTIEQV